MENIDSIIEEHINDIIGDKIPNITFNSLYDIPVYKSKENNILKRYNKKILVISGGGIKGIAIVGALRYLYDSKRLNKIQTYAGTSIGGVLCGLLCMGYTPKELYKFVTKLDLKKIQRTNFINLLNNYGLDNGDRIETIFKKLIKAKGYDADITLKELYDKTKKKLYITGTCLNDKKAYYFSFETDPEMKLSTAFRITTSLPIFFSPVNYKDKLFVDGGCINNYPMNLFRNELHEVIGIFSFDETSAVENISNPEEFIGSVLQCFLMGLIYDQQIMYNRYTIFIKIENMNFFDLNIDDKCKEELYQKGYDSAYKLFT